MILRKCLSLQSQVLLGIFAVTVLFFTVSASAEPVLRIVTFTAANSAKQQEALNLADEVNKVYSAAKGFQWVKFYYDASTRQTGSVSLWDSPADVDAFLKSDAYKGIPDKLKPLIKGKMSSKVYKVYEPKK
jgi:heme-degrading monooxygenase HmoA